METNRLVASHVASVTFAVSSDRAWTRSLCRQILRPSMSILTTSTGDRGLPKCSGCTKSRKTRDCVYDAVRIRQSQHTAPPELSSEESNAIRFDCSPRGDQEDAEAAWRGGRTRPDQEEPDLGLQPILGDQLTPASSMEVFAEPTGLLQNLSSNSAHLISPELQSASAGQQPSPSLFSRDIQESPLSRLADSVVKVSDVVESRVFDFFIRVVGCWVSNSTFDHRS